MARAYAISSIIANGVRKTDKGKMLLSFGLNTEKAFKACPVEYAEYISTPTPSARINISRLGKMLLPKMAR